MAPTSHSISDKQYIVIITHSVYFTEAPCEIKTPLKDLETMEGETITLVLEITKPRSVKWFRGKDEIGDSDHFKIDVDSTSLRHTITVKDITLEESTTFTVKIDDLEYGIVDASCNVTVKGMKNYKY